MPRTVAGVTSSAERWYPPKPLTCMSKRPGASQHSLSPMAGRPVSPAVPCSGDSQRTNGLDSGVGNLDFDRFLGDDITTAQQHHSNTSVRFDARAPTIARPYQLLDGHALGKHGSAKLLAGIQDFQADDVTVDVKVGHDVGSHVHTLGSVARLNMLAQLYPQRVGSRIVGDPHGPSLLAPCVSA